MAYFGKCFGWNVKLRYFETEFLRTKIRVPQKECGKRSSITFFRFRDAFGHFSVTFLPDAFVTFFITFLPDSFCRTPFAAG